MRLTRVDIAVEAQSGDGRGGAFELGDIRALLPDLTARYAGQARLIYLDPPFLTGKQIELHVPVGEHDMRTGRYSLTRTAYADDMQKDEYWAMMRGVLAGMRELLTDDGSLFLHVDNRTSARFRLLLDELFGENRFVNEIIWAYKSGGRSTRYFSRKHDNILYYRKGGRAYFDISRAGLPRGEVSSNHMRRRIDSDGRAYRSIRTGGKVYTYYEDDPVYPTDVWTDISHLQQRDVQRTGFETQKPLKLLERIVGCASDVGDLVIDPFAGSGTTLEAAYRLGRRFLGVDRERQAMRIVRGRLRNATVRYTAPPCAGDPAIDAAASVGIGFYHITLTDYRLEPELLPGKVIQGLDGVCDWAVGYGRGDGFTPMAQAFRDRETPRLPVTLRLPALSGDPILRVCDVLGRTFFYRMDMNSASV